MVPTYLSFVEFSLQPKHLQTASKPSPFLGCVSDSWRVYTIQCVPGIDKVHAPSSRTAHRWIMSSSY